MTRPQSAEQAARQREDAIKKSLNRRQQQKVQQEQKQKQNHATAKVAIVLQSLYRAKQGRKKAVEMVNDLGTLLARPGTIQGRSGWYEYQEKCLRYDVSGDEWIQKEGPISVQEWKMKMRAELAERGSSGGRPTAAGRGDVVEEDI